MIPVVTGLAAVFLLLLWQVQSGGKLVTFDGLVNAGLARLRTRPALAGGAWPSFRRSRGLSCGARA